MKKTCYKCNTSKNLDKFYNAKTTNDGKQGQCKKCANEYQKEWQKNNPEKVKEYDITRYNKHIKPNILGKRKKYSEKRTKDLQSVINCEKTASQLARDLGTTRQAIRESLKHRGLTIKKIKENHYNNKYKYIHKFMYNSLQKTLIPYARSIRFQKKHPEIWESYEKKYNTTLQKLRVLEYRIVFPLLYRVGHNGEYIRKKYNIDSGTVWKWLNRSGIKSKKYNGDQVRKNHTKDIIKQYNSGWKSTKLANHYSVSIVFVHTILKENGIKINKFKRPNSKNVIDKYVNKQWTITKILRHYKVSNGVIYSILRENKIKLRKKVDKLKKSVYVCTSKLNKCLTKSNKMTKTTKLNKEQRLLKIIGGSIPSNVLTYMRKNPRHVYKNLYSRSNESIFGPYTSKLSTRTLNRVNGKLTSIKKGFRSLYTTEQLASFKSSTVSA